jgi:hypothetical protein
MPAASDQGRREEGRRPVRQLDGALGFGALEVAVGFVFVNVEPA